MARRFCSNQLCKKKSPIYFSLFFLRKKNLAQCNKTTRLWTSFMPFSSLIWSMEKERALTISESNNAGAISLVSSFLLNGQRPRPWQQTRSSNNILLIFRDISDNGLLFCNSFWKLNCFITQHFPPWQKCIGSDREMTGLIGISKMAPFGYLKRNTQTF